MKQVNMKAHWSCVVPVSTPDSWIEAAHVQLELGDEQFLIAHGASRFLKVEKVQDMKRKAKAGAASGFLIEVLRDTSVRDS